MRDLLVEKDFSDEIEEKTTGETFDYQDTMNRWIARDSFPLLVELYLAAAYCYKIKNELALVKGDFDQLCSFLHTNFLYIPASHRSSVIKDQLGNNRCDLKMAEEGVKPKLGSNFPPYMEKLVERLDEIAMTQGSHSICLDS